MKRFQKSAMGIGIILILASIFVVIGCRRHHSHEDMADKFISRLDRELDLDDTQMDVLETAKTDLLEKVNRIHGGHDDFKAEIKAQLEADTFNPEDLEIQIADKRAKMGELIQTALTRLAQLHATLSPEQKDKLIQLIEEHEGRFKKCGRFGHM